MCRDYDSKTSNCDAKNVVNTGFTRNSSLPIFRGCLKDHGLTNMQNAIVTTLSNPSQVLIQNNKDR